MDLEIYKHIKNSGIVEHKIRELYCNELFSILGKHNPYWDSEHEEEANKLDEIRMKLLCISDDLEEIINIINEVDRKSFI